MPRARSKIELIEFSKSELDILFGYISQIKELNIEDEYIFEDRKLKDIIAHLYAWHILFDNWYKSGMKGEQVEIPAPGYTFKDTPKLNEELYKKYKSFSLDDISDKFIKSSKKIISIVKSHSEEELFVKKRYKWTGSTSLGSYLASATSSHYNWANGLLKKFIKKHNK